MACGDVLSLEDLQTAKKHQIFEAEVITGKAGGVAGGAGIDTATNPVTGQTQQTLPSLLADLGFDVQSWTSSTGGVLASANQVFLNDTPGSLGLGDYYAWGGTFPKTVPAGTDPALPTSGYVMRSSRFARVQAREALRRSYAEAGYNLVDGSFEAGGTLNSVSDVLLQESSGKAYGWAGAFPKVVAAGSGVTGFVDKSGAIAQRIVTTVAAIQSGVFKVGDVLEVSDRGGAKFNVVAGTANGFDKINAANGNVADYVIDTTAEVDPIHIGAKFDGVFDDSPSVNRAMAIIGTAGAVKLSGRPRLTAPLVFNANSIGVRVYAERAVTVKCDHNGNGVELALTNENYGGCIIENITFNGPNTHYPAAGYVPTSAGSGLYLRRCFDLTMINVKSFGFREGISIQAGYNNKCVGDCRFMFNQTGVLILGGQSYGANLNSFDFAKIRENRIVGVLIDGLTTGSPHPTMNSFKGAYIENNLPFADGYPSVPPGDGSNSVGVLIKRGYDNDFSGTYFERQDFDVIFQGNSSGNNFDKSRHAPNKEGGAYIGKILFSGVGVNNNSFNGAKQISFDATTPNVFSDNELQSGNTFRDTVGFNFIPANLLSMPHIVNNRMFGDTNGTASGLISRPTQGYIANPTEGTKSGTITGIGTSTATLNAFGLTEVQLGNQITSPTTITTIAGLTRGSFFILWNYQVAHPVTIKSGTATGNILLNGLTDKVLDNYGDSILFWVNGLGRAVQVGQNIN